MSKDKQKVVTGDYNWHSEIFERLLPDIKRIFSDEGMPIPKELNNPYKLLDEVIFRGFEGEENPVLNQFDFFNFSKRIGRQGLTKKEEQELREVIREHKKSIDPKEKYKSRKDRVDRVQEIINQNQCTTKKARAIFNKEMREEIYSTDASFYSQRHKVYGGKNK